MINIIFGWLAGLTSVALVLGGFALADYSYDEDNIVGFIGGLVMMVFGATMFVTTAWAAVNHWTF